MVGDTEKVVGFVRMFNTLAMVPISFAILFSYIFIYFKVGSVMAGLGAAALLPLPCVIYIFATFIAIQVPFQRHCNAIATLINASFRHFHSETHGQVSR